MSKAHPNKETPDSETLSEIEKHPDDVIVVPKGSSRARFIMTFLLVIMVLTTFSVSSHVVDVLGGRDKGLHAFMTWKRADGGPQSMSGPDFMLEKRAVALLMPLGLVAGAQNDRDPTDEQAATFILVDDAAREAGVRITNSELAKTIEDVFKTSDTYKGFLARYRTTNKDFESILRRGLRVRRYEDLIGSAFSVPDPAAVEKLWKSRHQEYAFDYVELPVATLVAEAKTLAPKGDELKAWFDALPQPEKDKFKTKALVSADLVAFAFEGDVPTDKLFAKYPRPQGEDLDALAKQYHSDFGYVRFPAKFEPGKPPTSPSQPFDDVKDQARKEAPIYNSLMDWQKDVAARVAKGEAVDLAAEAALLGLTYRKQAESINQDAWKGLEIPWVGRRTLEVLFGTESRSGQFLPAISVDEKGFVFARVVEHKAEELPAFQDMEAQVVTGWADKKAKEMAVERLEKLRDKFGTRPDPSDANAPPFKAEADAEKFAAAVKEAGYEVKHREFKDRYTQPAQDEPAGETYIRQAQALYTQKEETVVKAELNRDGTNAYLVRVAGVRDPDTAKINLNELDFLAMQTAGQERQLFQQRQLYSREYLQDRYGLDLESWHSTKKTP